MKNLSNTKKLLLGAGLLVAGYYAWKMWQSHEIEEKNKKTVATTVSEPAVASSPVDATA